MAKVIIEIKDDGHIDFTVESKSGGKTEGTNPSLTDVLLSIKDMTSYITVDQAETIKRTVSKS